MEYLRQYVFSLICMTLICGLVPYFFENNSGHQRLVRFTAGILILIVALVPSTGNRVMSFDYFTGEYTTAAKAAAAVGRDQADSMLAQIILQRTQTYILDKAASMGVNLSVEVILTENQPPVPDAVILTGDASPYVRRRLSSILISDLAISEEKLQWN